MKLRTLISVLAISAMLTPNLYASTEMKVVSKGEVLTFTKESVSESFGYFAGDNIMHFSQKETGLYSDINCGPTCIQMIGSYYDKKVNVQTINSLIRPTSKGYSVDDLTWMLDKYGLPYSYGYFFNLAENVFSETCLVDYIDKNYLTLLAINTRYIKMRDKTNNDSFLSNVGRNYDGIFNHFVLCTGYIYVNGVLYYQILDPLETGYTYIPASQLVEGMVNTWSGCLLFSK